MRNCYWKEAGLFIFFSSAKFLLALLGTVAVGMFFAPLTLLADVVALILEKRKGIIFVLIPFSLLLSLFLVSPACGGQKGLVMSKGFNRSLVIYPIYWRIPDSPSKKPTVV